ncbi:PREDICTED: uncharacterized protein LOC104811304 [Tarenaya hassleriana]|uniref:uncharacterized protein LOC104811304 n=1 Tax=Tarenaya hassleriana TaxID=28532 RepID=UPI00053C9488|nr:PREDICTED: uncharacterized protein LOC104811304 [Tarenaya hassleriana]
MTWLPRVSIRREIAVLLSGRQNWGAGGVDLTGLEAEEAGSASVGQVSRRIDNCSADGELPKKTKVRDSVSGILSSSSPSSERDMESERLAVEVETGFVSDEPKFEMASAWGRRRDMEDAVSIHHSFYRKNSDNPHFFGVFDGHGCSHVAEKCREQLYEIVKRDFEVSMAEEWTETMAKSFLKMDKEVSRINSNRADSTDASFSLLGATQSNQPSSSHRRRSSSPTAVTPAPSSAVTAHPSLLRSQVSIWQEIMLNRLRPSAIGADPEILDSLSRFPRGWRFSPTDEELVFFYLKPKIEQKPLPMDMIVDVDIYDYHPDTLSAKRKKCNDEEWFFFTRMDNKSHNSGRRKRKAFGGHWRATGKREVYFNEQKIGTKRSMVFHNGDPPNDEKPGWLMKEYCCTVAIPPTRQETDQESRKQLDYVLCKIYKKKVPKNNALQGNDPPNGDDDNDDDHDDGNGDDDGRHNDDDFISKFPRGFRFLPTDEELIVCYLKPRIENKPLPMNKILEVNIYDSHPDRLSEEYEKCNDEEWFFFTPRGKRKRNDGRPSCRKALGGYWRTWAKYEDVFSNERVVGKKRSMVFCNGVPPNGESTKWLMKEYCCTVAAPPPRQETEKGKSMRLDYVLCKIYKTKNAQGSGDKGRKHQADDVLSDNPPDAVEQQLQPPVFYQFL